jgi:hypothetical protein
MIVLVQEQMMIIGTLKNRAMIGVTSRATTGIAAEEEVAAVGKMMAAEVHGIIKGDRGTADNKTSLDARAPPSGASNFYVDFVDLGKTASFPTEYHRKELNKSCKTLINLAEFVLIRFRTRALAADLS